MKLFIFWTLLGVISAIFFGSILLLVGAPIIVTGAFAILIVIFAGSMACAAARG